jgi:hypothetical protein
MVDRARLNKSSVIAEIEGYLRDELASAADDAERRRIEGLLAQYRFLPRREYGVDDVIVPSALVELELNGSRAFYFVAPAGGGLVMRVEGRPVQVITPQSPLGEALLGRRRGERVEVRAGAGVRAYAIVGLS